MMRPEKINHALYALHLLLVRVRFMAHTGESLQDIAVILDYAEMLPRLIAVEVDKAEEFRDYLAAIVDRYPFCSYILEKFDAPTTPQIW